MIGFLLATALAADGGSSAAVDGADLDDQTEVRKVVDKHRTAVRYCFERELMKQPGLRGEIDLSFIVKLDGKASAVVIGPDDQAPAVKNCVRDEVLRWVFPRPKKTVTFTIPFRISGSGAR